MDIPNLPKIEGFEFKYYLYEEMKEFLNTMANTHKSLMDLEIIGQTYEGRDILCATITNLNSPASEKPAYYIDANIHAGEVTGSTVALYTIFYLLNQFGKEKEITFLLDNFTFYIIPRITADGAERYLTTPNTLRSSTRPWPFDYKLPGFHDEDINNDGEILLMRKEDPLGDWKISAKEPRLMIKREIDDMGDGPFYRLFPEGMLHEWQEGEPILAARRMEGLDLNRNNPSRWEQEYKQSGAGPFPLSEPETRAIADFFRAHENICGATTFHTFSGAILRPFSYVSDDEFETHDLEVYEKLGKLGEKITGYPCLNVHKDFRYNRKEDIRGGFDDFIFENLGIPIFTTELWDMIKEAGIEDRDIIKFLMYQRTEEEDLKLLHWNDEKLNGEGFEPWKEFEHPQLGKVEIGGWKFKFTWQNPPLAGTYLADECHKNALFLFAHAALSPRIDFGNVKIASHGEVTKISLSVLNHGFLPTYISKQALNRKVVKDSELKIECDGCVLLAPIKNKVSVPHLEGRSNKLRASVFGGLSPEDQKWTYNFTVLGTGLVHVTITTARAGTLHKTLEI
ncbi:MAG: carboxypeptidase [Candidatus Heimdallarchaeota archaeon]|nr:carboxypeptidase [Candidatus Heimdallarchaeota archaeon]